MATGPQSFFITTCWFNTATTPLKFKPKPDLRFKWLLAPQPPAPPPSPPCFLRLGMYFVCLFKCFLEYLSFLILGPPSKACSHQIALVMRSTLASLESWLSRTTPPTRLCTPVVPVAAPPPRPGLTTPSHQSRHSLDTSRWRFPTSHSLDTSRWRFPASHTLTRVPFNSNTEYTTKCRAGPTIEN